MSEDLMILYPIFLACQIMRYDPKKIEAKWQKKWLTEKIYEPDFKHAKKPFYNLMMFPYPSAEGLHVGNMYAFIGSDIYGRFKRMQEYDVFEPMGLDGFGIHSENYALKTGRHPMTWARVSERNFYRQLEMIGNGFAWKERLETYDPEYYRWTQWIFVTMFRHGLAYRKKQAVNWCPSCKTVLADEQVIAGACERCGTAVIKKELEQWFFKITDYAEPLLKNLETLDWSERVKIAQKNWIGKSEGAELEFRIKNSESRIKVFTTRPDTLFGATYLVLAPEHPLITNQESRITNRGEVQAYVKKAKGKAEAERIAEGKEKTGVELQGIKAINPANQEEIPIFVADYVLGGYGTGAIMAVPAHDERDYEFAKKFNLPIKIVVCSHYPAKTCPVLDAAYEGEGHLVGSGKFDGMASGEARRHITESVSGKRKIQYHLRDWLISRQRYWGPPIPMIFCEACAEAKKGERSDMPGWYAVLEKNLPVKLPFVKNFRPTGTDKSPLAQVPSFVKVRCPGCKQWARRETDGSDVFLDSAWYYLRYPSVREKKQAWNPAITKKWLPVSRYMGGAEHSVLHLLYVRFLAMALHRAKLISFEEPMPVFRAHGLIIKDGAKMSKSKGNIINPDEYIRAYGTDALRMYLMFLAPWEQGGDFRDTGIRGITRFLERVWKLAQEVKGRTQKIKNEKLSRAIHRTIKKVSEDIENLQYNTAISALMILLNEYEAEADALGAGDIKIFLKLLAPLAPHITEELWQAAKSKEFKSIHLEPWPQYDPKLIQEHTFELVIQVNGKVRGRIIMPAGASEDAARASALAIESVKHYLSGVPRKVIFVPNKLINFVI